jgi:hypothetical protein
MSDERKLVEFPLIPDQLELRDFVDPLIKLRIPVLVSPDPCATYDYVLGFAYDEADARRIWESVEWVREYCSLESHEDEWDEETSIGKFYRTVHPK